MTEAEWLSSRAPLTLLQYIYDKVSERKLRMYAVACCRRLWHLFPEEPNRQAVEVSERFAEGRATLEDLEDAGHQVLLHYPNHPQMHLVSAITWHPAWAAAEGVTRASAEASNFRGHAALMREIMGNPFRPVVVPKEWPRIVAILAQAAYDGEDTLFALHDALAEAGHVELPEHFRTERWHPKGCWALDVILGKS